MPSCWRNDAGSPNMEKENRDLTTRISDLLHKKSSSDVKFLVGHPPQVYRCHKLILAAGSEVFEAMFFGDLCQKSPVRVPDVEPRAFDVMLRYLYSDATDLRDKDEVLEVAYASKKYLIGSLFTACEDFLLQKLDLSPENILSTLEEASFLEMRRLRDRCLQYVSRNTGDLFHSKSFVGASEDAFHNVLGLELMDIASEAEVIEAIWLWGVEQCKDTGVECSAENVRDCTREFLRHVRFFALTVEELAEVLEKCKILDTADEMAVLWNVALGGSPKMPDDISTVRRTRSLSKSSTIPFPVQYRYNGNMTSFLIEDYQLKADITVTGPPVTVVGVVVAFRPIPCYSCSDRSLEVEVHAKNCSSSAGSKAKSSLRAEDSKEEVLRQLLLDNYVVIEEHQVASLIVTVTGEGVRLMHCAEETLFYNLGKSKVCVKFDKGCSDSNGLFPMKELMIV